MTETNHSSYNHTTTPLKATLIQGEDKRSDNTTIFSEPFFSHVKLVCGISKHGKI